MPARHLDLPTLERFVATRLDRERMIEAGRHLYVCKACRTRLSHEVLGGAELLQRLQRKWPGSDEDQYDTMFERVQAKASERAHAARREQVSAAALANELEARPPETWAALVREDRRFHNATLVDLLLERSRGQWGEDAGRAEELALLALGLAACLDGRIYGQGLLCDLKARAWAFAGNARRVRADLAGAEAAFAEAEALLDQGSCELLERALFLDLKASLLRSQRRFAEALEAIRHVANIYRRLCDPHLEGRALVSEAMILGYAGQPQEAIRMYFRAVARLDPRRDLHLAFLARHNLLSDLVEVGKAQEALDLLPEVQRVGREIGRPQDQIRLGWVEGLIQRELGGHEEAASKLLAAREAYIQHEDGFRAALVSLDLAKLYIAQGRTAETRRLAAEMQPIFVAKNIQREAIAALLVFQRAAEQEAATTLMVDKVVKVIQYAQAHPKPAERPA